MTQRTFFMLLKATSRWRVLDADAQRAVFDAALMTVFNGFPDLRMSTFNAGAFHGRCSHVIVWELRDGTDVWQYEAAVDALHAQAFFAAPLFEIVEVIAAVADDADELSAIEACAVSPAYVTPVIWPVDGSRVTVNGGVSTFVPA